MFNYTVKGIFYNMKDISMYIILFLPWNIIYKVITIENKYGQLLYN